MHKLINNKNCWLVGFVSLVICIVACAPKLVKPTTADLNKIKTLAIVVPDESDFTLIEKESIVSGAGGLVGIIGNIIQRNEMEKKVAPLLQKLGDFPYRLIFIESFKKMLFENGRLVNIQFFNSELDKKEIKNYDAIIIFLIQSWGIQLLEPVEKRLMATFITLKAEMIRTRDNKTLWYEHDTVLGKGRHSYSEYQNNGELLRKELKEVIEDAGRRMSYTIIY
jgi:hypothetical protein